MLDATGCVHRRLSDKAKACEAINKVEMGICSAALGGVFREGQESSRDQLGRCRGVSLSFVGLRLAENTVRRYCGIAKQFFAAAVKKRIIESNPFSGVVAAVTGNAEKFYFVSRSDSERSEKPVVIWSGS